MMHIKNYKGAGVLLFKYNKETAEYEALLGKRSIRQGYGKWAIPGGGRERFDADFREVAYRELWEETGIDISLLQTRDVGEVKTEIPFFHWRTFLVLLLEDAPALRPREFSELKWVPVAQIGKLDLWISLSREIRAFNKALMKRIVQ